jgi:large subunit ribosomal protein L19
MAEEKNISSSAPQSGISEDKAAETEVKAEEKGEKDTKGKAARPEELKPGMTIRVYQKIKETNAKGEEKERLQYFDGMIIARKHGNEAGASITVRKISEGVGVEKVFPIFSPTIDRIVIKKQAKVRKAKLYFLRGKYNKKLKEKTFSK